MTTATCVPPSKISSTHCDTSSQCIEQNYSFEVDRDHNNLSSNVIDTLDLPATSNPTDQQANVNNPEPKSSSRSTSSHINNNEGNQPRALPSQPQKNKPLQLQQSYKSYFRAVSHVFVNLFPLNWRLRRPLCVLLGRHYDLSEMNSRQLFLRDFKSHVLFTYRYGFDPLACPEPGIDDRSSLFVRNKNFFAALFKDSVQTCELQSDSGWGCMIRVFQMAVAQVVKTVTLGRDWHRPSKPIILPSSYGLKEDENGSVSSSWSASHDRYNQACAILSQVKGSVYPWSLVQILNLCRDAPSARFSIHEIVNVGYSLTGIPPGQWFGPTSCARTMTALINGHHQRSTTSRPPFSRNMIQQPLSPISVQTDRDYRRFRDACLDHLHLSASDEEQVCLGAYHSENGDVNVAEVMRYFMATTDGEMVKPLGDKCPEEIQLSSAQSQIDECEQLLEDIPPLRQLKSQPPADLMDCFKDDDESHGRLESPNSAKRSTTDDEGRSVRQPSPGRYCLSKRFLVLFLSLRLGLDSFNLLYQPFIQSCFALKEFQGLASGGPLTSAYWFIAASDDFLFFLDPHLPVQPALKSVDMEARWVELQPKSGASLKKSFSRFITKKRKVQSPRGRDEDEQHRVRPLSKSPSLSSCEEPTMSIAGEISSSFGAPRPPSNDRMLGLLPSIKFNGKTIGQTEFEEMFFPSQPKQLGWRSLNPSMTLVFLVQSFNEFLNLTVKLNGIDNEGALSFRDSIRCTDASGNNCLKFTAEEGFLLI